MVKGRAALNDEHVCAQLSSVVGNRRQVEVARDFFQTNRSAPARLSDANYNAGPQLMQMFAQGVKRLASDFAPVQTRDGELRRVDRLPPERLKAG